MSANKILFIQPKIKKMQKTYLEYPLGIGLLASICKPAKDVLIYDENVETRNFSEIVSNFSPDIACFSLTTSAYTRGLDILHELKTYDESILTIAGASHASAMPQEVLLDGFDFVAKGRCDGNILKLLQYAFTNKNIDISKRILIGESKKINEHSKIDRNLFQLDKYKNHSIFTSIGCPYNCDFCFSHSGSFEMKKIEMVIEEILDLADDGKEFFFVDDVFGYNLKRIINFCESLIKNNININYTVQLRCDSINDNIIENLVNSGCKRILVGAESGSNKSLASVNKNIKNKTIQKAIFTIEKYNLVARTNWIIGLPGAAEDQKEFLKIINDCRPSEISIHPLIPFPGTKIWDAPASYGIKIIDRKNYDEFNMNAFSDNFVYECAGNNGIESLCKEIYDELLELDYKPINGENNGRYVFNMPLIKNHYTI